MKWQTLSAVLASAGLMAACGGGGSDSSSAVTDTSSDASVTLSGTAAKGLMAFADVKVHPIKADGSVDTTTVLASATTRADGTYTLPVFKVPKSQPYVVKVSANPDGTTTTHVDEVLRTAKPLPAGFAMRTVLVAPSTASQTTTASVTPFSEMAVAAATKASGGITATNAAQAVSTVTQLLGFDPIKVAPAANVAAATTDDEKKLAVMLTAVSQLANSGELGCATGDNGAKTQCVVEALASAASTTSIKLAAGSTDVSAKLGTAVSTVLADTTLSGSVGSSTLATVVANLGCTTNCAAATTGTTPAVDATATAIAAAKLLFAEIKSDWSAMFSRGGATSLAGGALNQQAWAFSQAMTDVRLPVDVMAKDVGTLAMGIDFYNDYKAGRVPTTTTGRSRGDASLVATDGAFSSEQAAYPAGCTVYQDVTTNTPATSPANANFIGCGARYYVTRTVNGGTTIEWRHGFTITPPADGTGVGTYTYTTRARKRVQTCTNGSCTITANQALQSDVSDNTYGQFSGTVTTTLSGANGDITKLVIAGDLPAAFVNGTSTLDTRAFKHTLAFEGTQTVNSDGTVSSAVASSSLVAKDSAGATVSTVTLKSGSMMQLPVSFDANGNEVAVGAAGSTLSGAHTPGAFSLNLQFGNASGQFEGVLAVTESSWDKSQTLLYPTKATLSGALRTVKDGVAAEFLKGVFTATATGVAGFDVTAPKSSSNKYSVDASFVGTITAPNRPTLELSAGSGWINDSEAGHPAAVTMQYRTLVNGTPRTVVSLTGSRDANTGDVSNFKLSEATSNLVLNWTVGAATADLWLGDTSKIGSLALGSGVLTFSDSSLISLDIGL